MLKRILVPLDGSPLSDSILTQVRRILLREDAEIMFLRVLSSQLVGEEDRLWMDDRETPRAHLDRLRSRLLEQGARAHYSFRKGDAAEEILKFASEFKPSLIAMSTHGRTGLARLVRGSVAERVLRQSSFPLLLLNPHALEKQEGAMINRFRRILVPLDGADESAGIIPLTIELAKLYESEVILLHVIAVLPEPYATVRNDPEELQNMLRPFRNKFDKAGIPVRVEIPVGVPPLEILKAAEDDRVDLLAMTTHGRSGLSRWVLGSVAENVLRHCSCPILLERTSGFQGEIKGAGKT